MPPNSPPKRFASVIKKTKDDDRREKRCEGSRGITEILRPKVSVVFRVWNKWVRKGDLQNLQGGWIYQNSSKGTGEKEVKMNNPFLRDYFPPFPTKNKFPDKPKVDIVGVYEKLTGNPVRRLGIRTMVLCPLHEESHPSCVLYPESNSFNCFAGCGGGDVFTLIQKIKNCDFKEALEIAKSL